MELLLYHKRTINKYLFVTSNKFSRSSLSTEKVIMPDKKIPPDIKEVAKKEKSLL